MASNATHRPPPLLFRKASTESSPPPSPNPDLLPDQHAAELRKHRSSLLFIEGGHPARPLDASSGNVRPAYIGRQVTPPSPPSSLFVNESEPMDSATQRPRFAGEPVEQTPPSSLRDKFSRVFKGHRRGSSEATSSTRAPIARRPRAETLSSTNSARNALAPTLSSRSSVQQSEGRLTEPNSRHGSGRRQATNSGEVRIEIHPRPWVVPRPAVADAQDLDEDGSTKYYDFYTGRTAARSENGDEGEETEKRRERDWAQNSTPYLPPIPGSANTLSPTFAQPNLDRSLTMQSDHSSASQERKYAEEATSSFGFEGFHFGLPEESGQEHASASESVRGSRLGAVPMAIDPPRADSSLSHNGTGFCSSSGKASSSVLDPPARSNSSLGAHPSMRSVSATSGSKITGTGAGRPAVGRSFSSSSYFVGGVRLPSANSRHSDEVAKELKRLSKISAGSGMSGLAIVVAADGAGDEQEIGTKWTAEEKGKGKAPSPHEHGRRRHTRSGVSEWTDGNEDRSVSEDNDDSRSLLRESKAIEVEKKLKSQEPASGVIIHQGDQRYDFVYRMRQTADDDPILVPQYNYIPGSSFPNRNALTAPIAAKGPKGVNDKFSSRAQSSLTKPPSAYLRSPVLSYPSSIMQGDAGFDNSSLRHSRSSDDMGSLARRDSARSESRKLRSAVSMGSLGSMGGGFHMIAVAPEGTDERLVGSPLAEVGTTAGQNASSPHERKIVHYDEQVQRLTGEDMQEFSKAPQWRDHLRSLPIRPGMGRRSITPRLWAPRDVGDMNTGDLNTDILKLEDGDAMVASKDSAERRRREAKMGRMVLALCILFPPLLFIMAGGGFDSFASSLSGGEFRKIGSAEKRIALMTGSMVAVGAVVGVAVGLTVGLTIG